MELWMGSELLFYGGIAVMAAALLAAVVAAVILRISGKRLQARLEEEFGPKRH